MLEVVARARARGGLGDLGPFIKLDSKFPGPKLFF